MYFFKVSVHMSVCVHTRVCVRMPVSQLTPGEMDTLPPTHGCRNQTQVFRLYRNHLHLLSHLTSPELFSLIMEVCPRPWEVEAGGLQVPYPSPSHRSHISLPTAPVSVYVPLKGAQYCSLLRSRFLHLARLNLFSLWI